MQRFKRESEIDKRGIRDIRVEFGLNNRLARAGVALVLLSACSLLVFAIVSNFTVGVLTDERVTIARDTLAAAAAEYPYSSRLHARLAEVSEQENAMAQAQEHALRAVKLSPHNYNYRLLLASIEESSGDSTAAERSLRAGVALAPNKTKVHWQLANVLLREGRLGEAVGEFRMACVLNPKLLPVSLNLVWRSSGGNLEAVEAVTSSEPEARLRLALFLLKYDDVDYASNLFGQLGPRARLASAEAREFLDALIAAGDLSRARNLWMGTNVDSGRDTRMIWNASFESDIAKDFAQFDWTTYNNEYAKIRIGTGPAHTGSRSLRIDFLGRDTTRLDGEIKQLIILQPNRRYRLEFYAMAESLVTPDGPRVVVTTRDAHDAIASSEPVAAGVTGWQHIVFEFVAPSSVNGEPLPVYVTIKRRPKFSYDEPTRGTVYFDDFTLTEQPNEGTAHVSSNRQR